MTELVISNEQFRNESGMVDAKMAANAHKFVAEMKLVAEAVLETGEKLLVGRRKINEATGGFTQSFYVPSDKADLVTRNINVRRDSYRTRDDLAARISNLENAEVITGRHDVIMAERRYDYESANARRLGLRDIHAAGGIADKAKYRDVDHPYATAMYLPLDKAAYEARSGRSRAGWVQAQFNNAMSAESRNERGYARDVAAQKDDERRRREEIKEDREDFREQQRKQREQDRVQREQKREQERLDKMQERARLQAEAAAERAQKAEERRRSAVEAKAQRAEERRRRAELQRQLRQRRARRRAKRSEEKAEERQRVAATVAIAATLASILTAARSILNSLTSMVSTAAGAHGTGLPSGFSSETPIVNALTELIGRIPIVGIVTPVVEALLDEVKEVRAQSVAGFFSGLSTSDVRFYNTTDISHGLVSGTTVGAIQDLAERWSSPVRAAENKDAIAKSAAIVGDSIGSLFGMGLEGAGITPESAAEMLLDKFYDAYQRGVNTYDMPVSDKTLLAANLAEGIEAYAPGLGTILRKMMYDSSAGYLGPYSNWEEWLSATRAGQMLSSGMLAVPELKLDLASMIAASFDDLEAQLKASFSKFMLGFTNAAMSLFDTLSTAQYLFMSSEDRAAARTQARGDLRDASGAYRDKASEALAAFNKAAGTSYSSAEDVIKMERDWLGGYSASYASDVLKALSEGRLSADAQKALWEMDAAMQLYMTAEHELGSSFPVYNAVRFSGTNYTNLVETYGKSTTSAAYRSSEGRLPSGVREAFDKALGGYSAFNMLEQIYNADNVDTYSERAKNVEANPMYLGLDLLDTQLEQLKAALGGDERYKTLMELIVYGPNHDIKYDKARELYEVLSKKKNVLGNYVYKQYGLTSDDVNFLVDLLNQSESILLWDLANGTAGSYGLIPPDRQAEYANIVQKAFTDAVKAAGGVVEETDAAQAEAREAALEAVLLKDSALNAVADAVSASGALKNMQAALGKGGGIFGLSPSSSLLFAAFQDAASNNIGTWAAGGGFKGETTYNLTIPIGNIGEIKMTLKNNDGTVSVPYESVNFTAYSGTGQ